MALKIFTTYYNCPRYNPAEHGAAIRISNGRPKYQLPYALNYHLPTITPTWALVKDPCSEEEFKVKFKNLLERRGFEKVKQELEAIAADAGTDKVTVMCFEKNAYFCHRSAFADWWEGHGGSKITEV